MVQQFIHGILDSPLRPEAACRFAALPRSGKRRVKDYTYSPYGELTAHQGSSRIFRDERERAATGKADRTFASGPRAGPDGVSTMRTDGRGGYGDYDGDQDVNGDANDPDRRFLRRKPPFGPDLLDRTRR